MWDLSKIAILLGVLTLSGLFWWLPSALVTPAIHLTGLYRNVPDYYIEHFQVTEMDVNGRPKYQLQADKMVHYPHETKTQLVRPRLTEYGPGEVTRSSADTGWISRSGKHLLMLGNVTVNRSQGAHFVGANIVTQRINIVLR